MTILSELNGQILDEKYLIDRRLGEGGMGAVYLARHLGTRRAVALKVIAPQYMAYPEFIERFKREAEAAGCLRHPNVVNVTDFGFANFRNQQLAYLVMEYLDGQTLSQALRETARLPLPWIIDIIEQICSAIETAHQQGIIHRDLKPDNIWLEPNRRGGYTVKILDFGLAKLRESASSASVENLLPIPAAPFSSDTIATAISRRPTNPEAATEIQVAAVLTDEDVTRISGSDEDVATQALAITRADQPELTRVGTVLGTPLYMSPEQCRGDRLDKRTDIYSLGVIAYQMMIGHTPFQGDMGNLLKHHQHTRPPSLRDQRPDIPKGVEALVLAALAKDPAERPANAEAFAGALRAHAEGVGVLLRNAVSIYSEHFPTFLRIAAIANLPLITAILSLIGLLWLDPLSYPLTWFVVLSYNYTITGVVTIVNVSLTVLLLKQILSAPLRPVNLRSTLILLKQRLGLPLTFTVRNYGNLVIKLVMAALPSMRAGGSGLIVPFFLPVFIIEGKTGPAANARSRELEERIKQPIAMIRLIGAFFFFIPAALVILDTYGLMALFQLSANFFIVGSLLVLLFQLLWLFPLLGVALSLLYFKARQAGGEPLIYEDKISHEGHEEHEVKNFIKSKSSKSS